MARAGNSDQRRDFIRNVQITGDPAGSGASYIAGMDEGGGGFPHNDINLIFKSTDGGVTWYHPYTGPSFPGPGVTVCWLLRPHVYRWRRLLAARGLG